MRATRQRFFVPRRAAAVIVGTVLLSTWTTGCGGATPKSVASTPSSPPPTAVRTTTSPPSSTTVPGLQRHEFSFTESAPGGYTESGSILLGEPTRFRKGLTEGDLTAGTACTLSGRTDAVIPGRIQVENSTKDFNSYVAIGLGWYGNISRIETRLGGQSYCLDNLLRTASTEAVSPGEGMTVNFFLVLYNYFTPAFPKGNRSLLDGGRLDLLSSGGADGAVFEADSVGGSGAVNGPPLYSIPLTAEGGTAQPSVNLPPTSGVAAAQAFMRYVDNKQDDEAATLLASKYYEDINLQGFTIAIGDALREYVDFKTCKESGQESDSHNNILVDFDCRSPTGPDATMKLHFTTLPSGVVKQPIVDLSWDYDDGQ